MEKPRIYADFHNADADGRVRLNCVGTTEDLSQQRVQLCEGMVLTLYSDDLVSADELQMEGTVRYSQQEECWVAAVDWSKLRRRSDEPALSDANKHRV